MVKSNHLFTSLLAYLLVLTLLPVSVLALTENTMESAPEVSLPEEDIKDTDTETSEDSNQNDYIYRPVNRVLPERGTVEASEELDLPRLTEAELTMVQELMAVRKEGNQTVFVDHHYAAPEKVFEAGVYPLDPEAFGGNTFYVVLPYFQMDRTQLLSLISAFEELGIPFDPDSLNSTNCARGTSLLYHSATRDLSYEEQKRMNEIQKLIRRGMIDRESIAADSSCKSVLVQLLGYSDAAYDYLEPFCFYPYRAMTDNELAAFAFAQEITWEIHPDQLEKAARQYAHKLFPLPLSMAAHDESRYAYSEDYIEFRNYFRIDAENSAGMYASPDEAPDDVMVEQVLYSEYGSFPAEASVARILIDYPAMYNEQTGSQSVCSEEDLKAAAQRWAEKYLLIPKEDILSDWVFDQRSEDWGSVRYRLLTTDWLVSLEMSEKNAAYFQCSFYNRDHAVEYDDWNLDTSAETGAEDTSGTEESSWGIDPYDIDKNARQEIYSILTLPLNMITEGVSRSDAAYVQYRTDYSFVAAEASDPESSPDRTPESMIVYQTPRFSRTSDLYMECMFLCYPSETAGMARCSDEEYLATAQKWADQTLLIPKEEITADWAYDPASGEGTVEYTLQTKEWTIYLQMYLNGEYCWAGLYHQLHP